MVWSVVLAFLLSCVYGSFLEWFIHRVGMHTQYISKWAFKRHAIQHHSLRRSLRAFYASVAENARYEIAESSSVPALWFIHLPAFWLLGVVFGPTVAITVAATLALYTIAYEVLHFFIHTPRNYWFQRTRMFHFYCEYHRIHHHRARWNYNVVCPLADYVLRTFSLDYIPVEPSAPATMPHLTGPRTAWATETAATATSSDESHSSPRQGN